MLKSALRMFCVILVALTMVGCIRINRSASVLYVHPRRNVHIVNLCVRPVLSFCWWSGIGS
jgi:hypothetical protein